MRSFKDNAGRSWDLVVDVAAVKLVRARLKVDLLKDSDLAAVCADPIQVVDLLWVLCERRAGQLGVDEDSFYVLTVEDGVFERASCELLEELAFFFQKIGKTMMAKTIRATLKASPQAAAAIDRSTKKLDQKISEMVKTAEMELMEALSTAGK